MSYALNYTAKVTIETCAQCGAPIALANEVSLRATRQTFYCPSGHPQSYTANETDKLKAELAREKQRREMAEGEAAMERKIAERATKNLARITKRARNGVCTCCNRTFANLARHMATKHPEPVK